MVDLIEGFGRAWYVSWRATVPKGIESLIKKSRKKVSRGFI